MNALGHVMRVQREHLAGNEAARMLGIPSSTYYRIEAGLTPSDTVAPTLAAWLGVTENEVRALAVTPPPRRERRRRGDAA